MAYANGRLPVSALAPIAGGQLRKDAAAAWNSMNNVSRTRFGITLLPLGGLSSYRNYAGQVYLYGVSRPGWAAKPGTSNHGWGTTVDLKNRAMRAVIDEIGHKYGFSKRCSDASWEWWHIKWNPSCTGAKSRWKDPGPYGKTTKPSPIRALDKTEKDWAYRLKYHRAGMRKEERSGRGPKYRRHLRWARWYRSKIRDRMRLIQRNARKKGNGGWDRHKRGERYQLLKQIYDRKLNY